MKKIIKMIGYVVFVSLLMLVVVVTGFIMLSPQFGGKADGKRLLAMQHSTNFKDGKFQNPVTTNMDFGFNDYKKMISEYFKGEVDRKPTLPIPVQKIDTNKFHGINDSTTILTWFGHSAFLLEIDGKRLLLDPMLGDVASPTSFLGSKRYSNTLPLAIEQFPKIDAVLLSHDHYDHLDYGSIIKLKDKVGHFYVPLGLGAHLEKWGVDSSKITELDWWQEVDFEGLKFVSTPARHFSGRGLTDRFNTLWTSWVIKGEHDNIFFGGDSGYFDGFKQIGEKYGPFDITLLECGQYNELWPDIHMMPEQTAQAHVDLKGKVLMPIHWGAFTLAMHSWTEPVERLSKKAKELNVTLATPQIGESLVLNKSLPNKNWWQLQ